MYPNEKCQSSNHHKNKVSLCLQELVLGFILFRKWVFPLRDAANLSRHESEVTQGLHGNVSVGNFAEAFALPDVHGHHRRVIVLHPLNVSRVAVHGHHEAVAVGHKMGHLCGEPQCEHVRRTLKGTERRQGVQESYCIWCRRQEGWRRSQNRWHSSVALCSWCRTW